MPPKTYCGSYAGKRCNVELFPSTFVIHVKVEKNGEKIM